MEDQTPEVGSDPASDLRLGSGAPHEDPELIIGLVTPVGTETGHLANNVRGSLSKWGYDSEIIHISDELGSSIVPGSEHEDERIERLIELGNQWTEVNAPLFGLGRLIVKAIRDRRIMVHKQRGNSDIEPDLLALKPIPRMAYIIHSLKRPGEVEYLRNMYGSSFVLLGCQPAAKDREDTLARRLEDRLFWDEDKRRERARQLMKTDEEEGAAHQQNVRKTYPLADVFVPPNANPELAIRLLFGDSRLAPSIGEYAMFVARSSAARSLTASRRVGAAIVSGDSILATGWNEVPLVSDEESDAARGIDTSEQRKRELAVATVRALAKKEWLTDDKKTLAEDPKRFDELVEATLGALQDTPLMNVIEFQRAVHAEMWAILDAARRGIPLKDTVIYGTTWPCHLCWKHIFAVGIKKMYFIDSYPKSHATTMYSKTAPMLERFVGVAPRSYLRFFADRPLPEADRSGRIPAVNQSQAQPLIDSSDPLSYIAKESLEIDAITERGEEKT